MPASDRTKRLLAFTSGNRCAFPECPSQLHELGEAAHIEGEEPNSARHNPDSTGAIRNAPANLVYLCPNHHTLIDGPETRARYTVVGLRQIKSHHETRMAAGQYRVNVEGMAAVTFVELKSIVDRLADDIGPIPTGFDLTPLTDKIALNRLSDRTRTKISLGLGRVNDVSALIQSDAVTPAAVARVVFQFRSEYNALRAEGLEADPLFDAMHSFAALGSTDVLNINAGLAVLTYLFERCDVFERATP